MAYWQRQLQRWKQYYFNGTDWRLSLRASCLPIILTHISDNLIRNGDKIQCQADPAIRLKAGETPKQTDLPHKIFYQTIEAVS
jgi:hypothetical protein